MLSNDWHRMANPIARALEIHGLGVPGGHVYEFGVYGGGTMLSLWRLLRPSKIWGLDSFKGLPQHTVEKVKGWSGGAYSKDPRQALTVKMGEMNVGFVPGFYNDSLTDTLVEERCAITCRAAPSFLRVGHVELHSRRAMRKEEGAAEKLAEFVRYAIGREFPEIDGTAPLATQAKIAWAALTGKY